MSVLFDNGRRGAQRVVWGYNFVESYKITGSGKNMRFQWLFTQTAYSPLTDAWHKGELTPELASKHGGYVRFPTRYLTQPLPQHLDNLRHVLLAHRWEREITGLTFLKRWAKIPSDQLRKKDTSAKLIHDYLDELKHRGLIGDYSIRPVP